MNFAYATVKTTFFHHTIFFSYLTKNISYSRNRRIFSILDQKYFIFEKSTEKVKLEYLILKLDYSILKFENKIL